MSNKERLDIYIHRDEMELLNSTMKAKNYRFKNQFVEDAIRFYCGYLNAANYDGYISPILEGIIKSNIKNVNEHTNKMIYALAVQMGIMADIQADVFSENWVDSEAFKIESARRRGKIIKEIEEIKDGYIDIDKKIAEGISDRNKY